MALKLDLSAFCIFKTTPGPAMLAPGFVLIGVDGSRV